MHERPTKESSYYEELKYHKNYQQSSLLKAKISVVARERWFFLQLKAKYAGMTMLNNKILVERCLFQMFTNIFWEIGIFDGM